DESGVPSEDVCGGGGGGCFGRVHGCTSFVMGIDGNRWEWGRPWGVARKPGASARGADEGGVSFRGERRKGRGVRAPRGASGIGFIFELRKPGKTRQTRQNGMAGWARGNPGGSHEATEPRSHEVLVVEGTSLQAFAL